MTVNGARYTEPATAHPMEKVWAGRRLAKTERLARELVERLDTIPQPLLAALLIKFLEEAEHRKRLRGLTVPTDEGE